MNRSVAENRTVADLRDAIDLLKGHKLLAGFNPNSLSLGTIENAQKLIDEVVSSIEFGKCKPLKEIDDSVILGIAEKTKLIEAEQMFDLSH